MDDLSIKIKYLFELLELYSLVKIKLCIFVDDQSNNTSKSSRPNLVDPNMFVPYLTLLSVTNTSVKKSKYALLCFIYNVIYRVQFIVYEALK